MEKMGKRKSSSKKATHEKRLGLSEKIEILKTKYLQLLESHNHNAVVINNIKNILVKKEIITDADFPDNAKIGGSPLK